MHTAIKKLKPNIYITTLTDVYAVLIIATFGGEPDVLQEVNR